VNEGSKHLPAFSGIPETRSARRNAGNIARVESRLRSFSFPGRSTGHHRKKAEPLKRPGGTGVGALDADERRAASLARSVEPEPQNGSITRPPGSENDSMSGVSKPQHRTWTPRSNGGVMECKGNTERRSDERKKRKGPPASSEGLQEFDDGGSS
jgi:hypothetical protein